MKLTGKQIIGFHFSGKGRDFFYAKNPVTGITLKPKIAEATEEEINEACSIANQAFKLFRHTKSWEKAAFLDKIANELGNIRKELIKICNTETGLSKTRLDGELDRTIKQIYLFSELIKNKQHLDIRIDTAISKRQPSPKPDIRQTQIPLGPVAVFGASNFPLAFSVAGGDTISAFAAGCPVIVKANPSHPQTSEIVAMAISRAAQKTEIPDGVFSLIQGLSHKTGLILIKNPLIKAVGYTGSFKGGKTIFDTAAKRSVPIPVYAEMGSVNPIFLLPDYLQQNAKTIASGFINSVTLGAGQFCTNPGLFFIINSEAKNEFIEYLKTAFNHSVGEVMLNEQIYQNYQSTINKSIQIKGVKLIATGSFIATKCASKPMLLETDFNTFYKINDLKNEIFGPSTIGVKLDNKEEVIKAANNLDGQLTVSVFCTLKDQHDFSELFQIIENKAGRLILNDFPTGVEVCHAIHHGGPFPATTDVRSTSVGTAAIKRFLRPISYQNYSENLLPDELKNNNLLGVMRLVNGKLTNKNI